MCLNLKMKKIILFLILVFFISSIETLAVNAQYVGNVSSKYVQDEPIFHKSPIEKNSQDSVFGVYMVVAVAIATIGIVITISLIRIKKSG